VQQSFLEVAYDDDLLLAALLPAADLQSDQDLYF
jgi:hypothetical protein